MKKVKSKALTLLIILLFGASTLFAWPFGGGGGSSSSTLVVDNTPTSGWFGWGSYSCENTSNPYSTIQDAINHASNGDTIKICKGNYQEAVTVDKDNLTITNGSDANNPSDVVIDAGSQIGITLKKSNITLENFKVKSSGNHGIYGNYDATGEHTFKHLIIDANSRGIYLDNGSKQTFEDLDITAGDIGIYTDSNVNGDHTYKDITIHSTGNAIQIDKGGKSFENLNLTSDNGRGIDVVSTSEDLTFEDISIHSKQEGILTRYNATGEKSFNNINISSEGKSIYVDGGKKATFDNIEVNSSNDMGIYLSANPTGDHTFNHIKINSKKTALFVGKGGKSFENLELNSTNNRGLEIDSTTNDLTIKNITIHSKKEGIYAPWNVYGAHNLSDISINSEGTGINFARGFSSLKDVNITSKDRGIDIAPYRDTTIDNVDINTSEGKESIVLRWGAGNAHVSIKNSKIYGNQSYDGIYTSNGYIVVDSVCIDGAKRGIYFPWDVNAPEVTNTDIKNTSDWAVTVDADRSHPAQINNNCFSGDKLAYSNGLQHNFNGNYWDGVSDSNGDGKITHADDTTKIHNNVVDNSPKSSCEATGCGGGNSTQIKPLVNYQMDECEWDGTSGEVVDSANGDYNATAQNGANTESNTTAGGGICHVGDFIEKDKALLTDGDISLPNEYTIILWAKFPIDSSNHTDFNGKQYYNIADRPGPNSDYIYFKKDSNNWKLCVYGNNYECLDYNDVSTLTGWHYLVFKVSNNGTEYYLDGNSKLSFSEHPNGGKLGLILNSDYGSNSDNQANGQSIGAYADEFKIFDKVLRDDQIQTIYDNEYNKKNYDGTTRNCQICVNLKQCYTDNFDRTELGDQWTIIKEKNYTPQIESNKLMLTKNDKNIATGVTLSGKFPANNNYIVIEFEHNAYGNGGNGADGITVALADASVVDPLIEGNVSNIAGAYGGSLGYAQRNGIHGFKGGWLGIGLDEFGNYSNPTEGRIGGPGKKKDAIAIRGHWDESDESKGYEYINGTDTLSPGIDANTAQNYKYKISIDTRNSTQKIKIERDIDGNGYQTIIDWFDASQNGATPPENFKLSFTGSTGGSKNYHSIDYLNIGAVSCGNLGEDENETNETINYTFDAWNDDHNIADRNITTKIVKQDFNLTIASLDENGTNYREFNGTVCATVDNNTSKLLFIQQQEKNTTFNISKAIKDVVVQISWKRNVDENCPMTNDDGESNSTDDFAIRPERFSITIPSTAYAGEDFSISFKALDNSDNNTTDYNETKDDSFEVNAAEIKSGCKTGTFNLSDFNFSNGIANNVDANYSEVGEINITIKEKNGNEFAKVDSDDTNDSDRLITPYTKQIIVDPYEANITEGNLSGVFDPSSSRWIYMDSNLSELNVTANMTISVNNKQHQTLQDFNSSCYAKDIKVTFYYDVDNANSDVNLTYDGNLTSNDKSINDINKTLQVPASHFTTKGETNESYSFNIDRDYTNPLNPIYINLKEINVTDSNAKDKNGISLDNNATFYYGRIHPHDIYTGKKEANTSLYLEVYDDGSSSYTKDFNETVLNWYINKNHTDENEGNVTEINSSSTTLLKNANSDVDMSDNNINNGTVDLTLKFDGTANSAREWIHVDIPSWLWYIPADFGESYNYSDDSNCTSHPCFMYVYDNRTSGNMIKSGDMNGSSFDANSSTDYERPGVKFFR